MTEWFKQSIEAVANHVSVDPKTGLDSTEAASRLKKYGNNRIETEKRPSLLSIFFSQFKDILIIILLVSASVSLALSLLGGDKDPGEAILIYIIVFAIAVIGFF